MTESPPVGESSIIAGTGRGQRRRTRPAPVLLLLIASAIAALAILPVVYLLVRSSERGISGFIQTAVTLQTAALLGRTLVLVVAVVALALTIAIPAAWLVARSDLRGRSVWGVLLALPLVFPSYIAAFTFVSVFGPRGLLTQWLGVEALPELAYGFTGALATLALFSYPYIFLPLVPALRQLDPALEESARTLGRGATATFFTIVLPQLKRPIAGGALLVTLYVLSDFGAVSILRYDTFTTSIYDAYRGLFDRTVAAILGTVLVALTLIFVGIEWLVVRGARSTRNQISRRPRPVRLGAAYPLVLVFLGLVVSATFIVPAGSIIAWTFRAARLATLSLDLVPIGNALLVSFAAAIVATTLAMPVSFVAIRHRTRFSALLERLTYGGFALPGIIIALALVFFATRYARPIYQSFTLLVVAYVIRFLPEAVTATSSALGSVSERFEEAARSLGRSPMDVFRTITFPMVRGGVLAGGALVFLTAMKELPATLILRPTGFESAATRIWTAATDGAYSDAAIPALLLIVVSGIPLYTLVIRPSLRIRN